MIGLAPPHTSLISLACKRKKHIDLVNYLKLNFLVFILLKGDMCGKVGFEKSNCDFMSCCFTFHCNLIFNSFLPGLIFWRVGG